PLLHPYRRHQAPTHAGAVIIDEEIKPVVARLAVQDDTGDLPIEASHVVAPERSFRPAEESGPPAVRREQKAGAFVATGGRHDGGDRYLLPAPAHEMDLEPPDPALRPVAEAEYRHAEGNEEAFPLRERPAVEGMDARHVAPAFKRVIAEGVICLHSGQRCTKHRLPCPECRAGR